METTDAKSAGPHENAGPKAPPDPTPQPYEFSELRRQLELIETRLELLAGRRLWSGSEIQELALCTVQLARELVTLQELTQSGLEDQRELLAGVTAYVEAAELARPETLEDPLHLRSTLRRAGLSSMETELTLAELEGEP